MAMSAKDLYREAMRRTDAREHEEFLAMQADDTVWQVPGATLRGKDEVRDWLQPFWQAFNTSRHSLLHVYEVGPDRVVSEGTFTGTHDGPLPMPDGTELPPTGKTISFRFAMSVEREPGAEVANRVNIYFDQLEFLGQLGLLPAPAAA
jgi:ketosteroid isomerase-like protein